MKVDMNQKLTDLNGNEMLGESGPLTLGNIAITALMAIYEDEKKISGADKAKRYALALRINNGSDELTLDEAKLIKDLVGKGFGPAVVGPVWNMMEN